MKKAKTGKVGIQGYFNYLNEIDTLVNLKCKAQDSSHFLSLENVHQALKVNLAAKVKHVSKLLDENKATKKDFTNSLYAAEVVRLSQAHIRYVTFWNFMTKVQSGITKCSQVATHTQNLTLLYGLNLLD